MKLLGALAAAAALALANPHPGFAQTPEEVKALGKQVETLRAGQRDIEGELQGLRVLLQSMGDAPSPPLENVVVGVEGAWAKGEKTARLTIIEFTDYQCPVCSRHFREVLPQLEAEYIKTGKVRYVLRDYPLEPIHPLAFKAAEAVRCAGDQGKYWEMHDRLLDNQAALAPDRLPEHARGLGLDVPSFRQCVDGGRYAEVIRKDIAAGLTAGIRGTPTFFLGLTEPDGSSVKALRTIPGALPYTAFKSFIDVLLPRKD